MRNLMKLNIKLFSNLNVGETYTSPIQTIKPKSYNDDAYQLKFEVKLESQSKTNNTSNITVKSYVRTTGNVWGWSDFSNAIFDEIYVKVNQETNYTLMNRTAIDELPTNNANNWVLCGTWNGNVGHTAQSTCTLYVRNRLNTENVSNGYIPRDTIFDSESLILNQIHNAPDNIQYSISELNSLLTNAGVSDNTFVRNLSWKQINITNVDTYDSETHTESILINGNNTYSSQTGNPTRIEIDFTTNSLQTILVNGEYKAPIKIGCKDSSDSIGYTNELNYNVINYSKPSILDAWSRFKRVGQTTGQAYIRIAGSFYNAEIGNINQGGTYKPTIKYKYWEAGTTEPVAFNNTLPSEAIQIDELGGFGVDRYNIGSTIETDPNYFDPTKIYNFRYRVIDNFLDATSEVITLNKANYLWGEYPDRVDFSKISVRNIVISHMKRTTAWLNPNPSSLFSSQTIYLDDNNFDELVVTYKEIANGSNIFSQRFEKGYGTRLFIAFAPSDVKGAIYERPITANSETSYTFGDANYFYSSTQQQGTNNNLIVPIRIETIRYIG